MNKYFIFNVFVLKMFYFAPQKQTFTLQGFRECSEVVTRVLQMSKGLKTTALGGS